MRIRPTLATLAVFSLLAGGCGGSGGAAGGGAPGGPGLPSIPAPGTPAITSADPHCAPTGPAVLLAWTPAAGATDYVVVRDGVARSPLLPAGAVSYDDVSVLAAKATYHYVVRAIGAGGSTDSADVQVDVPADVCPAPPPPAPGAFEITEATPHCVGTGPAIRLSWSASVYASAYHVFRDDVARDVTLPGSALSFEDADGIVAGQPYVYFVRADDVTGSALTPMMPVIVPLDLCPAPPAPPSPGIALATPQCGIVGPEVRVSWGAAEGATEYVVLRDGADVSGPLPGDVREFLDATGLVEGGTYRYVVRASNPVGSVDFAMVVVDVPLGLCPAPVHALPGDFGITGLAIDCLGGGPRVVVMWSASKGALSYRVLRDDIPVSPPLPIGTLAFEDVLGVVPGVSHAYFVRATNADGDAETPQVGVFVPPGSCPVPPPPTERIVNGSFTDGADGWTFSGDAGARVGPEARTPLGYAVFGAGDADGSMSQTVAIPFDANTAMLSFHYLVTSDETTPDEIRDSLAVTVQDGTGADLAVVRLLTNLDARTDGVYAVVAFDLTPFKGQTVRLQFSGAANGADPTVLRIDDVSLMADGF